MQYKNVSRLFKTTILSDCLSLQHENKYKRGSESAVVSNDYDRFFPQTSDVKLNRKAFKAGEISKEQYVQFNRNKIAECIKLQEDIGLDVLVHGEYERNDMVEYFGECLNGFCLQKKHGYSLMVHVV